MMRIVIRNGTVVDPANNKHAAADVVIEDGVIQGLESPGSLPPPARSADSPQAARTDFPASSPRSGACC